MRKICSILHIRRQPDLSPIFPSAKACVRGSRVLRAGTRKRRGPVQRPNRPRRVEFVEPHRALSSEAVICDVWAGARNGTRALGGPDSVPAVIRLRGHPNPTLWHGALEALRPRPTWRVEKRGCMRGGGGYSMFSTQTPCQTGR